MPTTLEDQKANAVVPWLYQPHPWWKQTFIPATTDLMKLGGVKTHFYYTWRQQIAPIEHRLNPVPNQSFECEALPCSKTWFDPHARITTCTVQICLTLNLHEIQYNTSIDFPCWTMNLLKGFLKRPVARWLAKLCRIWSGGARHVESDQHWASWPHQTRSNKIIFHHVCIEHVSKNV